MLSRLGQQAKLLSSATPDRHQYQWLLLPYTINIFFTVSPHHQHQTPCLPSTSTSQQTTLATILYQSKAFYTLQHFYSASANHGLTFAITKLHAAPYCYVHHHLKIRFTYNSQVPSPISSPSRPPTPPRTPSSPST